MDGQRKQGEEERRRLEQRMQQQQKLQSLGVLAGGIAHDFNNLLTAMLGHSDLLLMELPAASPHRPAVEAIQTASRRAADLVRQLLAYAGKAHSQVETVSINDVVRDMNRLLELSVSKKVRLCLSLAESLPAIRGDPTQIRQVLMNLMLNAGDAIGDAEGRIDLRTGTMDADAAFLGSTFPQEDLPAGRYAYMDVTDSGCGMDEATRMRMFEPFFTTKFAGRGLGLAAVVGIVRGHRGAIAVDSAPDKGTRVRVLFPALPEGWDAAGAAAEGGGAAWPWTGQKTVLVVDDEPQACRIAEVMLQRCGLRVIVARDGLEGVEVFARQAREIDLVLLDHIMPRLDGMQTLERLRAVRRDVPVVICSGFGEGDIADRFSRRQIAGVLRKPYTVRELCDVLRETLGARAQG